MRAHNTPRNSYAKPLFASKVNRANRYELERKRQLEHIFARDPSLAIQEEKLMEEARKIQALLKKKNEEMRRQLMQQSTADQDRLRRQNINARMLQPGSVSLRSSLIHSMYTPYPYNINRLLVSF